MSNITEYLVVEYPSLNDLTREVNQFIIRDGYEPLGGIQVTITYQNGQNIEHHYQAMIKREAPR